MESRKDLSKYLHNMDTTNIDLLDKELINDSYSNIRAFGIGKETEAQKKRRAKIKTTIKNVKNKVDGGKAVHVVNKVSPLFITMRGSLLGMLNMNLFGTATNMSVIKNDANQKYWNDIMQKFWMWGGDKDKIAKAVDKGKNKKRLGQDIMDKLIKQKHGVDGFSNAGGNDAANAGLALGVTAALGEVSALLLAGNPATAGAAPIVSGGSTALAAMSPIFTNYAKDKGASATEITKVETIVEPIIERNKNLNVPDSVPLNKTDDTSAGNDTTPDTTTDDGKILGIPKVAFWIGVSAVVLIGGYFGYKKFIAKK